MNIQIEKELEYLVKKTGKESSLILAEAVEEGVHILYKRNIIDAFMLDKIDRKNAVSLLGGSFVDELEGAWHAVESDIQWGMKNE